MTYEIRMIYTIGSETYNKNWMTFTNKKEALWYLRRIYGVALFTLVRVEDGKQIAHRDGRYYYDSKVVMD